MEGHHSPITINTLCSLFDCCLQHLNEPPSGQHVVKKNHVGVATCKGSIKYKCHVTRNLRHSLMATVNH